MDEYRLKSHTKNLHNAKWNLIAMCILAFWSFLCIFSPSKFQHSDLFWLFLLIISIPLIFCHLIFSASFFSFRRTFFVNFFSLLTIFSRIWQAHKNCCHRQHHQQHRQQHLLRSLRHFLKVKNTNSIQMVILAAYIHLRHIQIHLVLCRVTMWVQNIKKHFHYQFRP